MNHLKHDAFKWLQPFFLSLPFLLAGCGSLPTINPDMALHSPKPIHMEGARGPLSNKQSKAILAKLQKGADDTNIFDRHLAIEQEIGDSPLMVGNHVDLLVDGPATYESMFAAIAQATDTIDMETFILEPDDIGQRFVDALLQKQLEGVQVNLIYDSVGSLNTPKSFFQPLVDAGAHVIEYNPINPLNTRKGWELNERDHRKLLVIDGKIAYVGGINISSVYSSGSFGSTFASLGSSKRHKESLEDKTEDGKQTKKSEGLAWRDTHMRMEGPVVGEFQKLFMTSWEKQKGEPLENHDYFPAPVSAGRDVVRAIGSTPDDPFSLMYVTLISAINSAESQIYITNAYFVPDKQMLAALKEAAGRGVDVRILLPSTTDSNLVLYASHSYYDELLEAGVKIYERQDAFLHAKTAMIDGVWSTVGSSNMDWRSFLNNQEINAVILGQDFADRMQALYEKDLQDSKQITLSEWEHRSLLKRLKETGARLWARFL
ncbi:phospholipase D-like domain-containing protein [Methyloradius palustris]|nr:phospholipase D-like domain-containing protein [Methyloradius palustris]